MFRITTITGERAKMQRRRSLQVTVAGHIVDHPFWSAYMQDPCIIVLDLLARGEAMVDVPRAMLYLGAEAVALHAASREDLRLTAMSPPLVEGSPLLCGVALLCCLCCSSQDVYPLCFPLVPGVWCVIVYHFVCVLCRC